MSKLPSELTNPIINIINNVCESSSIILKKYNFSPNMITTLGLIPSYYCIKFTYEDRFTEAAVMYALYFYLDCLDGFYARKYDMCTQFGDWYDHGTDIIFGITLLYVLHNKCNNGIKLIGSILIILLFTGFHIGCQ
jgi:phosphatidylglycerophosphate synthase